MISLKNLILLFTISTVFFLACGSSNRLEKQQNTDSLTPGAAGNLQFKVDTAFPPQSASVKELDYWSNYSDFFSVYKCDDTTFGIAIDLETYENPFESLLRGYSVLDSLTALNAPESGIYKRPSLTTKLLNQGSEKFYVYCERGRVECMVDSVWYAYSECTSSLIFKLASVDTARYGKPLIASKKKLDLTYRKLEGFDKALRGYEEAINKKIDFPNEDIHAVQFAHNKEYVLTYTDNFTWYKRSEKGPGINSPGRAIFTIGNGHVKCSWGCYLDVIGIPCI